MFWREKASVEKEGNNYYIDMATGFFKNRGWLEIPSV